MAVRYALRDYQLRAVQDARNAVTAGQRSPLIVAPTGAGKTVIACHIIDEATRKGKRTLFIAHRKELIDQASAKLDDIGVDHGVIKHGHPRVRPDLPVQVASIQTLSRRLGTDIFHNIIVDEGHHAAAESYRRTLAHFRAGRPETNVLGLTATPYRQDGEPLGDVYDALIVVATTEELIAAGHLVEPRTFGRRIPDLSKVKATDNDYVPEQLQEVMDHSELVEDIVDTWKEKAAGRTTVAFAVTIEHSMSITRAFNAAGIPAAHIDSEMSEVARGDILARLASGDVLVVSNCGVLTEGWDLPRCSCVILARPTRSRSLWRQMCGRALRTAPDIGKVDCIILDHAGCWKRHGFLTDPDPMSLNERERTKVEAPVNDCPHCAAVFVGWPTHCPECGEPLPRGKPREVEVLPPAPEGSVIVEIRKPVEEIHHYEVLATTARVRGYKPQWVAHQFKKKFGTFPRPIHMGSDPRLATKMLPTGPGGAYARQWVMELAPEDWSKAV